MGGITGGAVVKGPGLIGGIVLPEHPGDVMNGKTKAGVKPKGSKPKGSKSKKPKLTASDKKVLEEVRKDVVRLKKMGIKMPGPNTGKPKGGGKKGGKDKGFYGHYNAVGPKTVKNPSTNISHKIDSFTAKPFTNMIKGPVGKAASIVGKGQH